MTAARQSMGRRAEELVSRRLAGSGWQIVQRNARTRHGELDLVARDARTLVFVEVKAGRRGTAFGPERPVLAVDPRKQRRLRRLAAAWLAEHPDAPQCSSIRFDVVGVTFERDGSIVDYEHLQDAF